MPAPVECLGYAFSAEGNYGLLRNNGTAKHTLSGRREARGDDEHDTESSGTYASSGR